MGIVIVGEICNFCAYAFVEAILVTPLGALVSLVLSLGGMQGLISGWVVCCYYRGSVVDFFEGEVEFCGEDRVFYVLGGICGDCGQCADADFCE